MKFLENILLAEYTTFKIGGKARWFCSVKNESDLIEALDFAHKNKLAIFVLGGGSNILVDDGGFAGLVIKMEMEGVSFEDENKNGGDEVLVTVKAGESWDELVAKTVKMKLWGLENLSGIPGTVGATPVQNIGAYGVEVKNCIYEVKTMNITDGSVKTFLNKECQFAYRESFFKTIKGKKYIITSVTFKLSKVPKPNILYKDLQNYFEMNGRMGRESLEYGSFSTEKLPRFRCRRTSKASINPLPIRPPSLSEIRKAIIKIRKEKFPDLSQVGTAGSFWKNPIISKPHLAKLQKKYQEIPFFPIGDKVKIPLAWILDNVCNLKGYKKSSVGLWKNQPLVVVAEKGATESSISAFAKEVATLVKDKTGIEIEREVWIT